jgi:DNA-binding XRE family transcriptional regulator
MTAALKLRGGARKKTSIARDAGRQRSRDVVTLSRAVYERLLTRLEEAEDRAALTEAIKTRTGDDYLPVETVERMLAGESKLRVWREHRKMTLDALADASGVGKSYISEIETGKKPGSLKAMVDLAEALRVAVEDLVRK